MQTVKTGRRIQMVDLAAQYQKIKPEVDQAMAEVIKSSAFINGPEVKSFQADMEKYMGIKHVIPCGNGTDALQIAFMALGLKPGDEVITPDFTFVATVEVVALLGLKPVLVDVDPETFNIIPEAIEKAITPKTKAIVPVHLFGQCADMYQILKIAGKHNLNVVEDNAQAIGAHYTFPDGTVKKAGTMGIIGTTSFFPSKNLGGYGDGGAIFTNDDSLAAKIRMVVNHGQSIQYHYDSVGVNSRLDSLQAAILRVKLKHLDEYAAERNRAATHYDRAFANHPFLKTPARAKFSTHVFHQYTLQVTNGKRDQLKEHLAAKGIPSMVYYPKPLHVQKAYSDRNYRREDFPHTEKLCGTVISLPMHTELDDETLSCISDAVLEFFRA